MGKECVSVSVPELVLVFLYLYLHFCFCTCLVHVFLYLYLFFCTCTCFSVLVHVHLYLYFYMVTCTCTCVQVIWQLPAEQQSPASLTVQQPLQKGTKLLKCNFPVNPHGRLLVGCGPVGSVGWFVGRSVKISWNIRSNRQMPCSDPKNHESAKVST